MRGKIYFTKYTLCSVATPMKWRVDKGTRQKLLSGYCPLRGYHFSKKPLADRGGTPLPPLTDSPLSFFGKIFLKGLEMMFFPIKKVKNVPKRPYNGPKRAKNA